MEKDNNGMQANNQMSVPNSSNLNSMVAEAKQTNEDNLNVLRNNALESLPRSNSESNSTMSSSEDNNASTAININDNNINSNERRNENASHNESIAARRSARIKEKNANPSNKNENADGRKATHLEASKWAAIEKGGALYIYTDLTMQYSSYGVKDDKLLNVKISTEKNIFEIVNLTNEVLNENDPDDGNKVKQIQIIKIDDNESNWNEIEWNETLIKLNCKAGIAAVLAATRAKYYGQKPPKRLWQPNGAMEQIYQIIYYYFKNIFKYNNKKHNNDNSNNNVNNASRIFSNKEDLEKSFGNLKRVCAINQIEHNKNRFTYEIKKFKNKSNKFLEREE